MPAPLDAARLARLDELAGMVEKDMNRPPHFGDKYIAAMQCAYATPVLVARIRELEKELDAEKAERSYQWEKRKAAELREMGYVKHAPALQALTAWLVKHDSHGEYYDTLVFLPAGERPETAGNWVRAPWLDGRI